MKTIAVVAKRGKPEALALIRQIRERYPALELLLDPHAAQALSEPLTPTQKEMAERAELVIVLGGDGTLIHAARMLAGRQVPILGINLGTLGFMTEIPRNEMFDELNRVLAGQFRTESRMKLRCRLYRGGSVLIEDEVLNDIVINKGALARIADHETSIDGTYVTTYKSDGVIVSTPTGSTAYALSAGGPIVHPMLDCMIVAPICPHALTQRPIVVPGDQLVSISLKAEVADVYLTLDGQAGHVLQVGDRIEVQRSENRVLLVRNPKLGYFAILREKLHWGER